MNSQLHQEQADIESLLRKTLETAVEYLASIDERPAATAFALREYLTLPRRGEGAEAVLSQFVERYGNSMPASNGARFWGFVTGGTTPAALAGDWLTSVYDLNLSSAANSVAPNIEFETIHLLRELFDLPAEFYGTFVTGATMSSFVGLAMGREWIGRQHGVSVAQNGLHAMPPFKVLGGELHSSIFKVLSMLGIGRDSVVSVEKLGDNREAVDVLALERKLERLDGQPCIIVANAGTVNTVDFDDFAAIAELKDRYQFWLHIDAAFGGLAACSPDFKHLIEGWEHADSITIDAHKWLNVPYDAAMIFTRHRDLQLEVFQNRAAYLGELGEPPDFVHLSPENSRRLRALPLWFNLLAYGRDGIREIVESNCRAARLLGDKITASGKFRLLAPVRMNVVCFTLADSADGARIGQFLNRLRDDGRVFLTPTVYRQTPGIRAALSNWRTTEADVEIAWQAMVECLAE